MGATKSRRGTKRVRSGLSRAFYRSALSGRWLLVRSQPGKRQKIAYVLRKGGGAREAALAEEFAHIGFRGSDREPYVLGTGLDVWEVIEALKAMGLAALLNEGDLSRDKIFEAIRFYKRYPESIDQAISENAEMERRLRDTEPSLFASLP